MGRPTSALGQLERLALLESLFGRVLIPPAVAREVAPGIPSLAILYGLAGERGPALSGLPNELPE